jgi:hypothetical protein
MQWHFFTYYSGYEGVGFVEEVGPSVSQELIDNCVLPLRGQTFCKSQITK